MALTVCRQGNRGAVTCNRMPSISKEDVACRGDYVFKWQDDWIVVVCDKAKCTSPRFRSDPLANDRLKKHFRTPLHGLDGAELGVLIARFGRRVEGATDEWVEKLRRHNENQRRAKQEKSCFIPRKKGILKPAANRAPVADMVGDMADGQVEYVTSKFEGGWTS